MACRSSPRAWAPAVPVVIAAVGVVVGPRAVEDSPVLVPQGSVSPVVREGVGGGVGLTRALSDVREPLSLGAEVGLTLAVAPILRRGRPKNGGGAQVVGLPQAYHESHGVLPALLSLPTVTRHDEPSVVYGKFVLGRVQSELASGRDDPRSRLKEKARIWAGGHAGDAPLDEIQMPRYA